MAAGVPVVSHARGAVGETTGAPRSCWRAADPSYVAAALHRVCTDDALRATLAAAGMRRAAELAARRCGQPNRRRDRRGGGRAVSGKVAFVTPRYGTQVVGGAETAVRQLAEHLRPAHDWEAEVHTTCAMDPHDVGRRARARDDRGQRGARAPSPLRPRPASRFLRSRRARAPAAPPTPRWQKGRRWVEYNGPVSPELIDAVCASDADVVAFTRTSTTPRWPPSARCRCPPCSTPPPTTSLRSICSVFRGTFGDADAICYYTASERKLGRADVPSG